MKINLRPARIHSSLFFVTALILLFAASGDIIAPTPAQGQEREPNEVNQSAPANQASDDIVAVTVEGVSHSDDPSVARSESLKDAFSKAALQVITQLIGESAVEKNSGTLKAKVLSQTSKFVQYYKSSEPVQKGDETVTNVNLKISVSSVKEILTSSGLLFQSEGLATILPVFNIVEKRDLERHFRWWVEEVSPQNAFLREQNLAAIKILENFFRPKNFFLIDPVSQHYVQWVPEAFRNENLTSEDLKFLGTFFKAQMLLQGEISFEQAPAIPGGVHMQIKFTAMNAATNRIVGEITRSFDGAANDWSLGVGQLLKKAMTEVAKDLVTQVSDEWTKGTFGATLLQVSLRGAMGYQDLENFKRQMLVKLGDVKSVRERRLERGAAVFEVDASGGTNALSKRLAQVNFDGFKLTLENVDAERVNLHWSKVQP